MERSSHIGSISKRLDELFRVSSRCGVPDGDVETRFESLASDLFHFQFEMNERYRMLCEARGIKPSQIEHWSNIPAVSTASFKEFDFSCLQRSDRKHVFYSSGTTEQRPSRHFHN